MITRRVLIADSDPHMQAFARRILAKRRCRIPGLREPVCFVTEPALSTSEAIQKIALHAPDLVVMEHWAPGLNGIEILEALRRSPSNALAIVAATRPSIDAAVEATKLGAFEFLAKPVSEQRLCQALFEATALQMGDRAMPDRGRSATRLQDTIHTLTRIPAVLARLATTAVSLY